MSNNGQSTRSINPIYAPPSSKAPPTGIIASNNSDYPAQSNTGRYNPQNSQPDILTGDTSSIRRKELNRVPETRSNVYFEEDIVKYPRIDPSSVPRPTYSQHNLTPHSPKPRDATKSQMMLQNIIGYTDDKNPAGKSMAPSNPQGGTIDHAGNGARPVASVAATTVQQTGQTQAVCDFCGELKCKYGNVFKCAKASFEASAVEGYKLLEAEKRYQASLRYLV